MGERNRKGRLSSSSKQNALTSSRFKKGMASALVGATVFGIGAPIVQEVSILDNVVDIEAAEGNAQIFAFDHYVLKGEEYNYLQNVSAFEIVDGTLVDLSADVEVFGLAPAEDGMSQEVEYRVVGSNGVEVSTTATITYGVNYPGAIQSIEESIAQVESEIARLDVEDEALQLEIDGLNDQLASLQAQVDSYEALSDAQDADITELEELATSIEDEIATITRGITHALSEIYDISQRADSQYVLIESEIASLEEQLSAFEESINERVAEMESQIPDKATQEQVDAVQARVDAFLADVLPIEQGLSAQLTALNILYEDVVNGSLERDEAMREIIAIQEERIDALQDTLNVLLNDSDGEIARLRDQLESIVDSVDTEAIQAELDALTEAAEASERAYIEQIEAAEQANKMLSARLDGYESIIADLEAELESMTSEMDALERILAELQRQEEDSELPGEENPEDELPADEDPEDELPEDENPEDELPVDEDPEDELPVDEDPEDELPVDENPEDELPVDEDPEDEVPVDENPDDQLPTDGFDFLDILDLIISGFDEFDEIIAGEDINLGGGIDLTDNIDTDDVVDSDTDTASGDGVVSTSLDDIPTDDGTGGGNTSTGGGNTSGVSETATTGESAETLPQTGSSFAALAAAGVSGLAAIGAGVGKFFRKRK